ncbi:MAG: CotH kinase family protein [Dysgonamonadaceae bacterium]|jgi:hypothetical protein|nr:CotH kinase family protein [Dysgonamonadaceae bacterium]
MPAHEEWCLQTFGFDKSLMRFPLAMYLGQHLNGIEWTPYTRYVELWVNQEYRGLYILTEKIGRDKNRIDIKKLDAESENLSGGYILEENTKTLSDIELEQQFFTGKGNVPIGFKYPKAKNVTPAQKEWIMNYMNEFETALWNDNFKDPINGYQKYIDTESFIDWTILIEHSADIDHGNNISNYLHKDMDKKLKMSAPWDFDRAYGSESYSSTSGNYVRLIHWYGRLAEDECYLAQYKARMLELKSLFDLIPEILDANLVQLENAGVIERETQRWAELPSWTGCETHEDEILFLKNWVKDRTIWCYNDLDIHTGIITPESGDIFSCFYSGKGVIHLSYVSQESSTLKIQLYSLNGISLSQQTAEIHPGENNIQLQAHDLANGIYILRLSSDAGFVATKKIALN